MKSFLVIPLLLCVYANISRSQTTVYANAQTNGITGFCVLCSITNGPNAVDGNTSTFASMTTVVGAGSTLHINMAFPSSGTASSIIGIGLGNPLGIISASVLSSVTFVVKNGASIVGTYTSGTLLAINLFSGSVYAVYVYPGAVFNEVDVQLNYTIGALSALNVYYASFSNYILGVSLSSFTAQAQSDAVLLSWSTASEHSNNFFTLERSADAETFTPIDDIAGAGTSTEEHFYSYADTHPFQGNNYYRLKQTDYDGSIKYSGLISARIEPTDSDDPIRVYPAPSGGGLLISGQIPEGENKLLMYNTSGQLVYQADVSAENGNVYIPALHLSAGIYFIRLANNAGSKSSEFRL